MTGNGAKLGTEAPDWLEMKSPSVNMTLNKHKVGGGWRKNGRYAFRGPPCMCFTFVFESKSDPGGGGGGLELTEPPVDRRPNGWTNCTLGFIPISLCCFANQISFPVLPSAKKKSGGQPPRRCEQPPKSAAQLFTISWLSEIRVIPINLGISRLKHHTYISLER